MKLAKLYRNIDEIKRIPDESGYYKWYCKKKELEELFEKLDSSSFIQLSDIEQKEEFGLFCIYVGISRSLRKRIDRHINDKTTRRSTLRRSLAAILCDKVEDKDIINSFIDKLYIVYETYNLKELEEKEKELINESYHILNVKDNIFHDNEYKKIKLEIIDKRKKMRKKCIEMD